jgi:signal peptidase I
MEQQTTTSKPHTRKPLIAGLLSVAAPGLGHIYCGRLVKGLVLFFVSFAFAPIIVAMAHNAASTAMLVTVMSSFVVMLTIIVYAIVDAALTARRIGPRYQFKEYNRGVIYLLFIVVSVSYPTNLANTIRDHILHPFKIPSQSMAPSILPGDRIFLNKAIFKTRPPRRGDVVIFPNPDDRRIFFMKRIVALPGETIEIINNVIHINGHPLEYHPMNPAPELNFQPNTQIQLLEEINGDARYPIMMDQGTVVNHPRTRIPHGYCFVMSDNRVLGGRVGNHSSSFPKLGDSRHFGPIPLVDVQGRLDYIYWSATGWSRFGRYAY